MSTRAKFWIKAAVFVIGVPCVYAGLAMMLLTADLRWLGLYCAGVALTLGALFTWAAGL